VSEFFIASLKHTHRHHEHITFWGKDHRGYTMVFGDYMGRYCLDDARKLNDGIDCIAVPCDDVTRLLSPEPYFSSSDGRACRFYDQRGPVVNNTGEHWAMLFAWFLAEGRAKTIKPECFRGKRRSFAIDTGVLA
jgi:hypothetical protein